MAPELLKMRISQVMGASNVSFPEAPGEDLGISTRERLSSWLTPMNLTGNAGYLGRLLLKRPHHGKNGHPVGSLKNGTPSKRLVVPGYASASSSFRPLQRELGGLSMLPAYEQPRFREPLSAHEAAQYVQYEIEASDEDEIDLICHSMGGIIALLACDQLEAETRDRIRHIITLGTPWGGTPVAQLLSHLKGDQALKELTPGSDLLRALSTARIDLLAKVVSIGSTADKIAPWSRCILPGAGLNVTLRKQSITHAKLLSHPRVAKMVGVILNEGTM